jgi:hypothetical protein
MARINLRARAGSVSRVMLVPEKMSSSPDLASRTCTTTSLADAALLAD